MYEQQIRLKLEKIIIHRKTYEKNPSRPVCNYFPLHPSYLCTEQHVCSDRFEFLTLRMLDLSLDPVIMIVTCFYVLLSD